MKDRLGLLFVEAVHDARSSRSSLSPSSLSARAAVLSRSVAAFFSINSASIRGGPSDSALAAELLAGDSCTTPFSTAAAVATPFAAAVGFASQVFLADAASGTALLKVVAGFASAAAVAASGRLTLSPTVSVGKELA